MLWSEGTLKAKALNLQNKHEDEICKVGHQRIRMINHVPTSETGLLIELTSSAVDGTYRCPGCSGIGPKCHICVRNGNICLSRMYNYIHNFLKPLKEYFIVRTHVYFGPEDKTHVFENKLYYDTSRNLKPASKKDSLRVSVSDLMNLTMCKNDTQSQCQFLDCTRVTIEYKGRTYPVGSADELTRLLKSYQIDIFSFNTVHVVKGKTSRSFMLRSVQTLTVVEAMANSELQK